jgi:hypothetical protein
MDKFKTFYSEFEDGVSSVHVSHSIMNQCACKSIIIVVTKLNHMSRGVTLVICTRSVSYLTHNVGFLTARLSYTCKPYVTERPHTHALTGNAQGSGSDKIMTHTFGRCLVQILTWAILKSFSWFFSAVRVNAALYLNEETNNSFLILSNSLLAILPYELMYPKVSQYQITNNREYHNCLCHGLNCVVCFCFR